MNKYNGINGYATYNDIFKQIETNIYHVQTKKHVPSGIPSRPLKKESLMPPSLTIIVTISKNAVRRFLPFLSNKS